MIYQEQKGLNLRVRNENLAHGKTLWTKDAWKKYLNGK